ncbi:hypothetical protein PM082_021024 [Marasmius tenuissimus]|nr:hypothetical protein PM082_021024 [Marasmius tenuissimus]
MKLKVLTLVFLSIVPVVVSIPTDNTEQTQDLTNQRCFEAPCPSLHIIDPSYRSTVRSNNELLKRTQRVVTAQTGSSLGAFAESNSFGTPCTCRGGFSLLDCIPATMGTSEFSGFQPQHLPSSKKQSPVMSNLRAPMTAVLWPLALESSHRQMVLEHNRSRATDSNYCHGHCIFNRAIVCICKLRMP